MALVLYTGLVEREVFDLTYTVSEQGGTFVGHCSVHHTARHGAIKETHSTHNTLA